MKTTQQFLLVAAALATTMTMGCKDDKVEFVDETDCTLFPNAPGCATVDPVCSENPGQAGCETYCAENPEATVCLSYCDQNPTEEQCLPPVVTRGALAYSYVSAIHVPLYTPPADGESDVEPGCCIDMDGDGVKDNNLGRIAWHIDQIFGDAIRATTIFQRAIDTNRLTLVVEYQGLPVDLTETRSVAVRARVFQAWTASNLADRMAGNGEFVQNEQSADFTTSTIAGGLLDAQADSMSFDFDMGAIGLGDVLDRIALPFTPAFLRANVEEHADDASKIRTTADGTHYLTGIIAIESLLAVFNDTAETCGLAEGPLLTLTETFDAEATVNKAAIACNYDVADLEDDFAGEAAQCQLLHKICESGERILQQYMDQDSNGDGVLDATSFGVGVELVGARIADPV